VLIVDAEKPVQGRPRSGAEETRQRILLAAEQLFSERGFKATAISQIAESLSMSPANIFKHFRSKTALAQAVIERRGCPEMTIQGTTPAERLEALFRDMLKIELEFSREEPELFAITESMMVCDEVAARFLAHLKAEIRRALTVPVDGNEPALSAEVFADVFLAVLHPSIVAQTDRALLEQRTGNILKFIALVLDAQSSRSCTISAP
jgi:TetR/AcrR family transcriptional repressor of the ameABC operon